ncbi:ATP-dependent Clp protease proteolytic subunit [Streptomyces parvulus]|uniref:ATP-dependent Clp protease proteolytic subunit n=1 Tax=Streptomyces parvulus TaxID=146923 RepID=UPI003409A120
MVRPSAHHVPPEFTERTGAGARTTDPYAKLLEGRIVLLGTAVDEASAHDVVAQLMHLEHRDPDRPVSLYVNSPGGSFTAMTAIYDTMRYLACDVETTCLGQAGAAAAALLAAGTPGRRAILPGARVVLRQPSLTEPLEGRAGDLAARAEELTRIRARLEEILGRHTGRGPAQVARDVERETVLDAQQAVAYGLVDRVLTDRPGASPTPRER